VALHEAENFFDFPAGYYRRVQQLNRTIQLSDRRYRLNGLFLRLFKGDGHQDEQETAQEAKYRGFKPPGQDGIIVNDYHPRHAYKRHGEESEHKGKRTESSQYFHDFSSYFFG